LYFTAPEPSELHECRPFEDETKEKQFPAVGISDESTLSKTNHLLQEYTRVQILLIVLFLHHGEIT